MPGKVVMVAVDKVVPDDSRHYLSGEERRGEERRGEVAAGREGGVRWWL